MCTSIAGIPTPAIASRNAILVWVKAPGLMSKASKAPAAFWIQSTRSPSALDWWMANFTPSAFARPSNSRLIASSVTLPYTSFSRLPRRFRLGPWSTKIFIKDADGSESPATTLLGAAPEVFVGSWRESPREGRPAPPLEKVLASGQRTAPEPRSGHDIGSLRGTCPLTADRPKGPYPDALE